MHLQSNVPVEEECDVKCYASISATNSTISEANRIAYTIIVDIGTCKEVFDGMFRNLSTYKAALINEIAEDQIELNIHFLAFA
ncbi:hypothetical protein F442_09381 [Phytophthora nicotianae P10297]|uniref:Uncharacterized protein n=1 Tax=Phytophthora nicotianae P10297 TaxID=1317064 RepID=W2ZAK2_PHYNI|nr:hypothetical protein F442_09381 [Phytophthora nicotianae P10297]